MKFIFKICRKGFKVQNLAPQVKFLRRLKRRRKVWIESTIWNQKWNELKIFLLMHIKLWRKLTELLLLLQIDSLRLIWTKWSRKVLNIQICLMNIQSFNKRNSISQQTLTKDINNEKILLVWNKFHHQVLKRWLSLFMRIRLLKL